MLGRPKVYRCEECGTQVPIDASACPFCGSENQELAFRPRYPIIVGSGIWRSFIGPYIRGFLTAGFLYLVFSLVPTFLMARAEWPLHVLLFPDNVFTYAVVAPGLAIVLRNFKLGMFGSVFCGFMLFLIVFNLRPLQLVGFWLDDPGQGTLQLYIQAAFGGFIAFLLWWEREMVDW